MYYFRKYVFIFFLLITQLYANEVDSLKILYTDAESDSVKVELLLQLTNKVRYYNNTEALNYGRKAYDLALSIPHNKALAESLFLLGRLNYSRSNFDSALIFFQQSLQHFKQLEIDAGIGDCLVGIGDHYYFIDDYPLAENYYLKAVDYYKKVNKSTGIGNTYISLGDLAYSMDNYIKASKYFQAAYPEYEKAKSKLGMATSINCMADIDFEQSQYQEARIGYTKAKEMFVEINDVLGIANCTKRLGDVQYEFGNYDSSFTFFNEALKLYNHIGSKLGQAYCIRSVGLSFLKLGLIDKALNKFEDALTLFIEIGDQMGLANSYYHFGEANYLKGNYNKAITDALKGFDIAQKIGSGEVTVFNTELLSKAYAKVGQYDKAYYYELITKETKDSLNSTENIRGITQLQMQFQFDQETKELELAQLKKDLLNEAELKRQKMYTYVGIICGILTLIVAYVFYKNYKDKQKSNTILAGKNEIIALKNKDLTDSIEYAKTLQNAILPEKQMLADTFPESFIYDNPKDIVSGDFHWFEKQDNHFIASAADCTGHGVPGAFMSLLGNEYLHQVLNNTTDNSPKVAILKLDNKIKESLHIHEQHKRAKDGMDMALCDINTETLELKYCGAYNPLYLLRNKELIVFEGNKGSVGSLDSIELVEHTIQLIKGDIIYMFSDGYVDQFGGEKNKKFLKKRFQQLLIDIHKESMQRQSEILHEKMLNWKGKNKQVDDILIIGIKI